MKKSVQHLAITLLIIFYGLSVQSQVFQCANVNLSAGSTSGNACPVQFINDFIPKTSDSILQINIKFHFIRSTYLPCAWDSISLSDFDSTLKAINLSLTSNPNPVPNNPNVTNHVTNTKLQFVRLPTVDTIIDDYVNHHGIQNLLFPGNATTPQLPQYVDPNSINIYFGGLDTNNINSYWTASELAKEGFVYFLRNKSDVNMVHNFSYRVKTIRHELSHALGLNSEAFGFSSTNVNSYCCNYIIATDHFLEDSVNIPYTNNVMSINGSSPYEYYSPQQLGLIHYKLRTSNKHFLSQNSYNTGIIRNPASDYSVQSNQTWTSDRYFKGNITIDSGKVLKIWCKVGMTKGSCIIVKKGAQLVVELNGNVTNFSGQLWGGINVAGTSSLGQLVNNTTFFAANHGVARIINGGKVSQAENGIKNYITDTNGNINWSTRGGVIIGDDGIFENNIRDVEFISYQSPLGNDRSMFINCAFRTDSNFNSVGPNYAHVSMWNTKGIQFKGCTFEHLAGDKFGFDHGRGIHSIDAIYSVDKNGTTKSKFNNLAWGVLAGNTNPLKVVNIQNSEFTDCEVDAVYLKNMSNAIFNNNIITIPYYYASSGLYIHTCKNYQVKNNSFEETPTQQFKYNVGLYAYNSQAGSHQIYNNLFSNLEQGISAIANNSGVQNITDGLKMNCNDFVSGSTNKYDIAMLNYFDGETVSVSATVMKKQGEPFPSLQTALNLVRNKYGAPSICSNCENKWYIQGTSAKRIDHGSNVTSDFDKHPTPQPAYSDTSVKDIPSTNITFLSQHCPVNPGVNGGVNPNSSKLSALNDYLSYLYENNIEGEDNLFFDIQATLSEKLNYFVSDSLPESADSLISLITNHSAYLTDPDLLLIYAYMNKGNYTEAEYLANNLGTNRSAWKSFLIKLIEVYEEDDMIYSLTTNTANTSFFAAYATNDTLDGQAASQALLNFVLNSTFTEPRLHPAAPGSGSYRLASIIDSESLSSDIRFKVYPNPTKNGVFIEYPYAKDQMYYVEIKDLTGRTLFTKLANGSGKDFLVVNDLSSGLYLIGLYNKNGNLLHSTKLVKQE